MTARRIGAALVEALFAATLSSMVAVTGITILRAQTQIARQTTSRSEHNDGVRAATLTLRAELDVVDPRVDVKATASDSIAARIFRGVAVVCGRRDSLIYVRYRGLRLPDAAKDSAVQIGVENAASIRAVIEGATCQDQPGERLLTIVMTEPAAIGSTWLLFENGSYELSSNALRYRRDAENRQPITAEIIDVRRSGFYFQRDSVLRSMHLRLRHRGTGTETDALILFLNRE